MGNKGSSNILLHVSSIYRTYILIAVCIYSIVYFHRHTLNLTVTHIYTAYYVSVKTLLTRAYNSNCPYTTNCLLFHYQLSF